MRASIGLALACLTLAGCSDDRSSPPAASPPSSDVSTVVAAAEWKAVIDDWYPDGTIDEPHRCEAVQEAIKQLPSRDYSDAYADLHRFERRACA